MSKRTVTAIFLALIATVSIGCAHRGYDCQKRGESFRDQVETIRQDANTRLPIGTKKEEVIRFFSDHNIPLTLDPRTGAQGTISTKGCSPMGCGPDVAIRVKVDLDSDGSVRSRPVVQSMYTNCL